MSIRDKIRQIRGRSRKDEYDYFLGSSRNTVTQQSAKIVIAIMILGIMGYLAFRQVGNWHKRGIDRSIEREKKLWIEETEALKDKIISLHEELRRQKGEVVSEEKLFEVFGEDAVLVSPEQKMNCEALERQIKAFYTYLDQKDYVKAYGVEKGISGLFQKVITGLSEKLPTVIFETRDIFTLTRNMAHLYRVLGKKHINLIKDILKNESDIIEPVMATFYAWFADENACPVESIKPPSLKILYEYTGFFLNTLAGRSYLFRRDSNVSTLMNYYCIQLLDRANEDTANKYGIDIRSYIDYSIFNLRNRPDLIYRKSYLTNLEALKQKYQMQ